MAGKNQRKISWHMTIAWNSNFNFHKVLLEHSDAHSSTHCLQLLLQHSDSWEAAAETIWRVMPKMFTIWPFAEEVWWVSTCPWPRGLGATKRRTRQWCHHQLYIFTVIIQALARGWPEHKKNWEQEDQLAASDDSQEVIRTKAGVNRKRLARLYQHDLKICQIQGLPCGPGGKTPCSQDSERNFFKTQEIGVYFLFIFYKFFSLIFIYF